jgi:hypothetical protein
MGLDWNPMGRPKPGAEQEFARLFRQIESTPEDRREPLVKRFQQITQPPFETLGAPRVGSDPKADDWLRERLSASGHPEKFDEARVSMKDLLGPELMERAYSTMLAHDLGRFAGQLHEKAKTYARAEGVEQVENVRSPEFEEGSPSSRAHILFWAARWCRFWAERGHGLEPWF